MIKGAYLLPHPPVIIPEIGRGREQTCEKTVEGMKKIAKEIKAIAPETIIVITPHGPVFSDGIAISTDERLAGDFREFGHSEIMQRSSNDIRLCKEIVGKAFENGILMAEIDIESAKDFDLGVELDHGTMVPLYFINQVYKEYKLIHITYGLLSHEELYKFGGVITKSVAEMGRKVVLIASGDLSHKLKDDGPYEFNENGPRYDACLLKALVSKNAIEVFEIDSQIEDMVGECGRRSIDIMLGALDGYDYEVSEISYEGPFGVGYGIIGYSNLRIDEQRVFYQRLMVLKKEKVALICANEDIYVKYARSVIESYVKDKIKLKEFDDLPEAMFKQRAGVFVSIKNDRGLRGCIGTIGATEEHIADEILRNAINASTNDPRFPEITPDELSDLMITVDILEVSEKITDIRLLDPQKYGIIVTQEYKRGVLLPNLEGIDTIEEQIRIVLNKAGIDSSTSYEMERFLVERHS